MHVRCEDRGRLLIPVSVSFVLVVRGGRGGSCVLPPYFHRPPPTTNNKTHKPQITFTAHVSFTYVLAARSRQVEFTLDFRWDPLADNLILVCGPSGDHSEGNMVATGRCNRNPRGGECDYLGHVASIAGAIQVLFGNHMGISWASIRWGRIHYGPIRLLFAD